MPPPPSHVHTLALLVVPIFRRAKPIMARLGVPIVDGGRIVDGQVWATKHMDGRHYHPLVPLELIEMLGALTSPPPPPMIVASTQMRD